METQSTFIRKAAAEEAELIADLSRRTFYDSFAADNKPANMEKFMTVQFSREKLMAEVLDTESIFLLAYEGNRPVGYAKMIDQRQPNELKNKAIIEIERLYAVRDRLGAGVGMALMEACIAQASERKREVIWLGVWETNHRAIAFYRKWGFEKFSQHIFILGDDPQTDWLMKKDLQ